MDCCHCLFFFFNQLIDVQSRAKHTSHTPQHIECFSSISELLGPEAVYTLQDRSGTNPAFIVLRDKNLSIEKNLIMFISLPRRKP